MVRVAINGGLLHLAERDRLLDPQEVGVGADGAEQKVDADDHPGRQRGNPLGARNDPEGLQRCQVRKVKSGRASANLTMH